MIVNSSLFEIEETGTRIELSGAIRVLSNHTINMNNVVLSYLI